MHILEPGDVVQLDGQRHTYLRTAPYKNGRGKGMTLWVWQSYCYECGASFECQTPVRDIHRLTFTRRCKLHASRTRIKHVGQEAFLVGAKAVITPTVLAYRRSDWHDYPQIAFDETPQAASLVGSASREALHTVKPLTPCDVCAYPEDCIAANSCSWKEC